MIQIELYAYCDGCSKFLIYVTVNGTGMTALKIARSKLNRKLRELHFMERTMMKRKTQHFCRACANRKTLTQTA